MLVETRGISDLLSVCIVRFFCCACLMLCLDGSIDAEDLTETAHWAFRPLPPPDSLLSIRSDGGEATRLDSFLAATLAEKGLEPSPISDRRTLIRRLYFDVTGLPPDPGTLDSILNDHRPDSWERLVDRLLASPAYGEKWSRMWLDQVRYADLTATWLTETSTAWLYRDWVIRAFNEDVPYPEFVQRQLATDLMPETGPEDMPALGFLGLSPTYWKELKLSPEVIKTIVADEWEERVDMMSRTLLGLTVSCARCHDHKTDPITMRDYYALAGVVANIRLKDRPMLPEKQWKPIEKARAQVRQWRKELEMQAKHDTPESSHQAAEIETWIASLIKATPGYDLHMAHAIDDAFLEVIPDGPDATRLVYHERVDRDLNMHLRGDPNRTGDKISRGFLELFGGRTFDVDGSARLEWVRSVFKNSGALAARVIVNRVWMGHFGEGLVSTPGNFGRSGASPTHKDLLDDLSTRFVVNGWSLKWLHREILLSRIWRQSSQTNATALSSDPQNKLLWHMPRRRLSIEAWRDAMLAVSGTLYQGLGGVSENLSDSNNHRRTVYGTVHRRELHDILKLHDFPDPNRYSEQRIPTTTPVQQLFALNGSLIIVCSDRLANRCFRESGNDAEVSIRIMFKETLCRDPKSEELSMFLSYFNTEMDSGVGEIVALTRCAQTLLTSNEFLYVD